MLLPWGYWTGHLFPRSALNSMFVQKWLEHHVQTIMKGETLMCQMCLSHYKECDGPCGPDALGASHLDTPYGMSMMISTSSVLITIRKPWPRFSMWISTILTPPTGTVPNLPGSGMPRQTRSFPFSGNRPIARYYKVFGIDIKYYLPSDLIVSHSSNQMKYDPLGGVPISR